MLEETKEHTFNFTYRIDLWFIHNTKFSIHNMCILHTSLLKKFNAIQKPKCENMQKEVVYLHTLNSYDWYIFI